MKFIIIGDASNSLQNLDVGKSCILMQLKEGKFKFDSEATVGVEFGSKTIDINN
jgi:Ras-related protein Rab-2A